MDAPGSAEILTRTLERLSTADTLERVTETVAASVRSLMHADGATFVLREDDKCFYADEHAISPLWKGMRFPLSACISGWSMLHKQVVLVPDIYPNARIPHDAYRPTFVTSLCMAPIRAADPIGALGAYWKTPTTPSPHDVRLLEVLANSAAVALENLELRGAVQRRSAERDDLAGKKKELESAIHAMAHDLRTPLASMMGFAQLLDDGMAETPEEARLFARTIFDAGCQLTAQIDRMLSLYRITSKPIVPAPVDLSAIAREVVRNLRTTAGGRDIDVRIEDGLHAVADPVLARLMLENLLANAFKYTSKKPRARIELGRLDRNAPMSTFFVRDDGDGFAASDAHRLFRPMTRLHHADEFPGTGLGLASVARIVEMHGGKIRAEGEKSVGAKFIFTLPVAA